MVGLKSNDNAIFFDSVTKKFRIYHDINPSLKETIIHRKRSPVPLLKITGFSLTVNSSSF